MKKSFRTKEEKGLGELGRTLTRDKGGEKGRATLTNQHVCPPQIPVAKGPGTGPDRIKREECLTAKARSSFASRRGPPTSVSSEKTPELLKMWSESTGKIGDLTHPLVGRRCEF